MKTAILLVNVGTPDKPKVKDVRRFLFQFLNDRRVIDLPWLLQKILVNLIIVPFRAPKSTKLYKLLWGANGSPLLHYTLSVKEKLQKQLANNYSVYAAMRYGKPSLSETLKEIESKNYDRIIVLPMFPQYASSTTGTINQFILKKITKWNNIPDLIHLNQFYYNNKFIKAFAQRAIEENYENYDHIVFSYHGLPLRQINKSHPDKYCRSCKCISKMPKHGKWCYRAQCYATTRLLVKELKLEQEQYTTAFQSRLSKNWLEPFSDKTLMDLAKHGKKKVLALAPSFVADCLETEVEIGIEYKALFEEAGGEKLTMAKSLNDMDEWIKVLEGIVTKV